MDAFDKFHIIYALSISFHIKYSTHHMSLLTLHARSFRKRDQTMLSQHVFKPIATDKCTKNHTHSFQKREEALNGGRHVSAAILIL